MWPPCFFAAAGNLRNSLQFGSAGVCTIKLFTAVIHSVPQ
jgi:hypothetical protein